MGNLHMTIDPNFTHTVIGIVRDKLLAGDTEGAEQFFADGFGITNKKLISKIIRGEYVMVFNEDGTGDCVHHESVSQDYIDSIGELPEYWSRENLVGKLRNMILNAKEVVEELFRSRGWMDFHTIHKTYDITVPQNAYREDLPEIPDMDVDTSITVTTGSLFDIFIRSKKEGDVKDLMDNIMESDSKAAAVLFICDSLEKQCKEFKRIEKLISYIKQYWEGDIEDFDKPGFWGKAGLDPEELLRTPKHERYWYILVPYRNMMTNMLQEYQYIYAEKQQQDTRSANFVAQQLQAETEIKGYIDFVARQKEVSDGPVKIDERPWDAGWIAPDGKVWAENGSTANMIHINLADRIFRWMGWEGTDEDSDNRDHKLEQLGWMKFHDHVISFAGYSGLRTTAKVTNRQKDRLVEYCKAKKYDSLYIPFSQKHINMSEIYSIGDDEWRDIFEW